MRRTCPARPAGSRVSASPDAHLAAGGNAGDHRARAADGEHILDPQRKTPGAGPVLAGVHDLVERVEEALEALAGDVRDRADGRVRPGTCPPAAGAGPRSPHSRRAGSTRSILVSATSPCRSPISVRMCRCSRVCGMMPSSAATTKITTSTPCAPATMLRMKSTCPGTSTTPTIRSSASRQGAKPRSMVSPRCFLLGQGVGLAAGEQLDQRGLAVVHVPGGAEHDVLADALLIAVECCSRFARAPPRSTGTCSSVSVRMSSRTRSSSMRPKTHASSRRSRRASSAALSPGTDTLTTTLGMASVGSEPLPR